jgi:hypothetical protein
MQRLTRKAWLRIATAPIIIIVAVVAAIIATDLATGGAHEPKLENMAPPLPSGAASPLPRTPAPTTARTPASTRTPTAAPTTISGPIAAARDKTRKDDIERIAAALEKYYDKKKEYPSTGGNLQTVCVYKDDDAGCKLEDFIDPIPTDPLGDSTANGYWYASDGKAYTLIAAMELPANAMPQNCPEAAAKHTKKTNLYCLSGSR